MQADVAQLVEQLIRNQQVVSSSLTVGSRIRITAWPLVSERSFLLGLLRLRLHVHRNARGDQILRWNYRRFAFRRGRQLDTGLEFNGDEIVLSGYDHGHGETGLEVAQRTNWCGAGLRPLHTIHPDPHRTAGSKL